MTTYAKEALRTLFNVTPQEVSRHYTIGCKRVQLSMPHPKDLNQQPSAFLLYQDGSYLCWDQRNRCWVYDKLEDRSLP